jgi:2-polyprenyl-3-methyl-5-hydroxy-6-metoxy-1,4-benzoquinol methylase
VFYDQVRGGWDDNPVLPVQTSQLAKLKLDGFQPLTALDLGCGLGFGAKNLKKVFPGIRITGADITASVKTDFEINSDSEFVQIDGVSLPFGDEFFDLILVNDVIEHVADTDSLIKEVYRVLSPEGFLLLSTPNMAAWFNRISLLFGHQLFFSEVSYEKIFGRPGTDVVGHLRLFTQSALVQFLAHHRFHVSNLGAAPFAALPKPLCYLDRVFCMKPSLAACLCITANKLLV